MSTNVRTFLREFSRFKSRARRGEVIRVQDREGEFIFSAATQPKSLLGSARGKMITSSDLTEPSLPDDRWKPSL